MTTKVKARERFLHAGAEVAPGDELELEDNVAQMLINCDRAEAIVAPASEQRQADPPAGGQ